MNKNNYLDKLTEILFYSFIFTLSFDRILILEVSIFTFRVSQVLVLFSAFLLYHKKLSERSAIKYFDTTFIPLLFFILIAALSITQSLLIKKSIGYFLWLIFDYIVVFYAVINFIGNNRERLINVTKAYIFSGFVIALFGQYQLWGTIIGIPVIALQGPMILEGIPKINGFSFEASYYVMYLLEILPLLMILTFYNVRLFKRIHNYVLIVPFILSILCSFSRTGFLALFILFFIVSILFFINFKKINKKPILIGIAATLVILTIIYIPFSTKINLLFEQHVINLIRTAKISGSKVEFKESSSQDRWNSYIQGLNIFRENPVIGVGIGGYGGQFHDLPAEKKHSRVTTNLWIELLAETGIFGFLSILSFITLILVKLKKKMHIFVNDSKIHRIVNGIFYSIIITFFVSYQFVQTLYRIEVWFLLGFSIALLLYKSNNHEKEKKENITET